MKNGKLAVICGLALALGAGCAAMEAQDKAIGDLKTQVIEIKARAAASDSRIEELDNRFHLLQEKLQTMQASRQTAPAQPGLNPPEGLKVVRLAEDGKRPALKPAKPVAVAQKRQTDKIEVVELEETPVAAPVAAGAGPDALYAQGQDLFIASRYDEAREVFSRLVEAYPSHGLADNALYWLGEAYYSEKAFQKALAAFLDVTGRFPKGNKAPDAMLKAAYSYQELNDKGKADETLSALLVRYPDSEAAIKAKSALARVGNDKK